MSKLPCVEKILFVLHAMKSAHVRNFVCPSISRRRNFDRTTNHDERVHFGLDILTFGLCQPGYIVFSERVVLARFVDAEKN